MYQFAPLILYFFSRTLPQLWNGLKNKNLSSISNKKKNSSNRKRRDIKITPIFADCSENDWKKKKDWEKNPKKYDFGGRICSMNVYCLVWSIFEIVKCISIKIIAKYLILSLFFMEFDGRGFFVTLSDFGDVCATKKLRVNWYKCTNLEVVW